MQRIGVGLLYIALVLAFFQVSSEGIDWNEIALGVLLACTFVATLVSALMSTRLRAAHFTAPLVAFMVGWMPFNMAWAVANGVDPVWAVRRGIPLFAFSVAGLAVAQLCRTLSEIRLVYGIVASGAVLVVAARLSMSIPMTEVAHLQEFRQVSQVAGGYYSILGATLLLPLVILNSRRGLRLALIAGVVVSFLGVVLSLTRTYWLVGVGSLFCLAILTGLHRSIISRLGIVLALALVAFGAVIVVRSDWAYFVSIRLADLLLNRSDESILNRWQEMYGAIEAIYETPISLAIGRGIGREFSFYSISPFYPKGTGYVTTDYLHNFYLYGLLQLGVPGLLLFLWPFMLACIKGIRRSQLLPSSSRGLGIGVTVSLLGLTFALTVAPPLLFTGVATHIGALTGIGYVLHSGLIKSTNLEAYNDHPGRRCDKQRTKASSG